MGQVVATLVHKGFLAYGFDVHGPYVEVAKQMIAAVAGDRGKPWMAVQADMLEWILPETGNDTVVFINNVCLDGHQFNTGLVTKILARPWTWLLAISPLTLPGLDVNIPGSYWKVKSVPNTALVFIAVMNSVGTVSWDASLPNRSHSLIVRMEQGQHGLFKRRIQTSKVHFYEYVSVSSSFAEFLLRMTTWQYGAMAKDFVALLRYGHARSLVYRICKLPFGNGKSIESLLKFFEIGKLEVSV